MIDIVAIPFLPVDITIHLTSEEKVSRVQSHFREWIDQGADLNALPNMLRSLRIAMERVRISPGGSAANALRVAQHWGCRTAIGGILGQDTAGDFIYSADTGAGIDLSLVNSQTDRATAIYLILVRDGMIHTKALITKSSKRRRVTSIFQSKRAWTSCYEKLRKMGHRVVHMNAVNGKLTELVESLPKNTLYSLNLRRFPDRSASAFDIERLLQRVQLLIISNELVNDWLAYLAPLCLPQENEHRCAALLEALFRLSPALSLGIVTRAEHGLVARTRNDFPFSIPAYDPIKLVDPTGAGDVFTGTLLEGLLSNGWKTDNLPVDIQPLLVRSAVAAALNCERLGATAQIPTKQEVSALINKAHGTIPPRKLTMEETSIFPRGFGSPSSPMARSNAGIPAAIEGTLGRNSFDLLIADFEQTKTLVAIGSGSSFSVACAIERLASRWLSAPYTAQGYRPGEYLALGRPGETVVCITQSGNADMEAAIQQAQNLGLTPFLIAARENRLAGSFPENHVFSHAGEPTKSFVNVRGPCAAVALIIEWIAQQANRGIPILNDYYRQYDLACKQVERLDWATLSPSMCFIALASGLMLAPLHEFDLKAAESGIACESYELKGWTHGRYQRVWKHREDCDYAFLTLETPSDSPIADELAEKFRKIQIPFYRLCADDDALGLWQQFVHVMLLVQRLTETMRIDPTALLVPKQLKDLRDLPLN